MDNHISERHKAPRNRTITLSQAEAGRLTRKFLRIHKPVTVKDIENRIICGDVFDVLDHMPSNFVDLLFVDPPYNVNKTFNLSSFKAMESDKYEMWLDSWVSRMVRPLSRTTMGTRTAAGVSGTPDSPASASTVGPSPPPAAKRSRRRPSIGCINSASSASWCRRRASSPRG